MTLRNLGQIATFLQQAVNDNAACHDDVDAFGAPSECHGDVSRGYVKACKELVADLEKSTGYTAQELLAEFEARVQGKWLWYTQILEPLNIVIGLREDAEDNRIRFKHFNQARLPDEKRYY